MVYSAFKRRGGRNLVSLPHCASGALLSPPARSTGTAARDVLVCAPLFPRLRFETFVELKIGYKL
jgi:hypothetical protein